MSIIKVLDEHIANQIAAGEVIERPASVVKELVENSLDANATNIRVDISQGGLELIRVTDNGQGMDERDVVLAFERHATSKIKNERSLFNIATLGFRGEALPSIAAISKLEIVSKRAEDHCGHKYKIHGSNKSGLEQIGCANGTTITVKDIFFNTPARLKHLKTINTEVQHIYDYLCKIAMGNPKVRFSFYHNGHQRLLTSGDGKLINVLTTVYGHNTKELWLETSAENYDFSLQGYIAKPTLNRSVRTNMNFFVNGRYIRNSKLYEAVIKAYHTLLPINKFPLVCLMLEMDYSLVDVNVHPAKLHVRFSKEKELTSWVIDIINKQITQKNSNFFISDNTKECSLRYANAVNNHNNNYTVSESLGKNSDYSKGFLAVNNHLTTDVDTDVQATRQVNYLEHKEDSNFYLKVIGQIHATYIVAQNENGLVLYDQHAAHERINYEKFMSNIKNDSIKPYNLLMPLQFNYSYFEKEIINEHRNMLAKLAIEIDDFGDDMLLVRSYPDVIPISQAHEVLSTIFEQIIVDKNNINIAEIIEHKLVMQACKASVKANQVLSIMEMEGIIDRLNETASPGTCPHGRPTLIKISVNELEKMFKRKQ